MGTAHPTLKKTNGVNDLFMLVGIKNELEERLHRSVDIVTYRENMNQFLKKKIDGEAVYA